MIRPIRPSELSRALAPFVAVLSVAAPALAFRTAGDLGSFDGDEPIAWAHGDALTFELAGELPDGIEQLAFDRAFDDAAATWAAINCKGPTPLLTWIARGGHEAGDGINTIGFVPPSALPGDVARETPAVTELQYERDVDGRWRIVEADLYLNAERDWSGDEGFAVDLTTVIAHELGHVAGLLHPCEPDGEGDAPECDASNEAELMFPLYYAEGTSLGEDDEQGYCYLYPERRCVPGERGCGPVDPCALGACDGSVGDGGLDDASVPDAAIACDEAADAAMCELPFASACTRGEQCASGLCIGETSSASTCTRRCGGDDGPCPTGFSCEAVAGEAVCVGPEADAGCSVTRAGRSTGSAIGLAFLSLALALLSRSARLRRCSSHKN